MTILMKHFNIRDYFFVKEKNITILTNNCTIRNYFKILTHKYCDYSLHIQGLK